MPNLVLDTNYTLTADLQQWIINLDGRPHKFFMDLENALNWYLSQKTRDSKASTIPTLIEAQKRVLERLHSLITSLKIDEGKLRSKFMENEE